MSCGGRVYKGDTVIISVPFDVSGYTDLTITYSTTGDSKIVKTQDEVEIEGGFITYTFTGDELDLLPDGVIYYTIEYEVDGVDYVASTNTNLYLKTPAGYSGKTAEDYYQEGYEDGLEACSGDTPCDCTSAVTQAYQDGYQSGATDTFPIAYQSGYTAGQADCPECDCSSAITEAYQSGYDEGWASGNTEGYDEGFDDGVASVDCSSAVTEAYQEGFDEGFMSGASSTDCSEAAAEAYEIGFSSGYSAGLEDCPECDCSSAVTAAYQSGYTEGSNDGYSQGEVVGKAEGYLSGYTAGYEQGQAECPSCDCTEAYESGWTGGKEEGYSSGYTAGYEQGQEDCPSCDCTEAYESGFTAGYAQGQADCPECDCSSAITEAFGEGYQSGYTAGLADCSGVPIGNITSIAVFMDGYFGQFTTGEYRYYACSGYPYEIESGSIWEGNVNDSLFLTVKGNFPVDYLDIQNLGLTVGIDSNDYFSWSAVQVTKVVLNGDINYEYPEKVRGGIELIPNGYTTKASGSSTMLMNINLKEIGLGNITSMKFRFSGVTRFTDYVSLAEKRDFVCSGYTYETLANNGKSYSVFHIGDNASTIVTTGYFPVSYLDVQTLGVGIAVDSADIAAWPNDWSITEVSFNGEVSTDIEDYMTGGFKLKPTRWSVQPWNNIYSMIMVYFD